MLYCVTKSRIFQISVEDIQFLFSYKGRSWSSTFQHNHYFPRKTFNLLKKEEKMVNMDDLYSQNSQKKMSFPKVLGIESSRKSSNQLILYKYWRIPKLNSLAYVRVCFFHFLITKTWALSCERKIDQVNFIDWMYFLPSNIMKEILPNPGDLSANT